MKKFIALIVAFLMLFNVQVFAHSYASVNKTKTIRDDTLQCDQYLKITPYDEVSTGSTIVISFTNAYIPDQTQIDAMYQYPYDNWNGKGFWDVMPQLKTNELPYKIRRLGKYSMEVKLINLPSRFANGSLWSVNGVNREPWYRIRLPFVSDGEGTIGIYIDSNETTISSAYLSGYFIFTKGGEAPPKTGMVTDTEIETISSEPTTEAYVSEVTTEAVPDEEEETDEETSEPTIFELDEKELVPVRTLSDIMSETDEDSYTDWDSATKTVTLFYKGKTVRFIHEGDYYIVDDEIIYYEEDEPKAEIIDKKMYIAAGVAIKALGLEPETDEETTETTTEATETETTSYSAESVTDDAEAAEIPEI